ncbi:MAG TPA: hypothetical protein ENI45_01885 [Thermoplasmatales archaeon]|nr:hypothetical protein [Thermoplasmatales archaeon]
MLIKKCLMVFTIILLLSPLFLPTLCALTDNPQPLPSLEKNETERLVDNLRIRAWRIPLWLQIICVMDNIPLVGFGTIDVQNRNNCSITLLMNDTVRWQDGTVIGTSHWSDYITPGNGTGTMAAYLRDQVFERAGVFGFYTLEAQFYVEEDGSSKTLTYTGVMLYPFTWLIPIPKT